MQFTARYDRAVLMAALNLYLKQKLIEGFGRGGVVALVLYLAALGWLLVSGDRSLWTGIMLGLAPVIPAFLFMLFLGWRRVLDRQLAAMGAPEAEITLNAHQIAVTTTAGSAIVPWARFTEIREYPGCWLLIIAANQFISLPTTGVPGEALDFIRAHAGHDGGQQA